MQQWPTKVEKTGARCAHETQKKSSSTQHTLRAACLFQNYDKSLVYANLNRKLMPRRMHQVAEKAAEAAAATSSSRYKYFNQITVRS